MENLTKIIIIVFFLALIPNAYAVPPLPMEVYGQARFFNMPVSPGTSITAIDTQGNICGEFSVQNTGHFGTLTCVGENTTLNGTGASPGENIRFRIGNLPASTLLGTTASSIGDLAWESGEFKQVILITPPLVCGDGFCDNYESCATCPEDCGECPVTEPGEPDPGAGIPGEPDIGFPDFIEEEPFPEQCVESWSCSEWSICYSNGTQTRECIDVNACETEEEKPETVGECEYIEPVTEERRERVERPRIEEPLIIERCDERLPILSIPSLVFIIIIFIIIIVPLTRLESLKKKVARDKYMEDMDKLKTIYHAERKTYTFLIIASVLGVIVYLYHYFFFLCEDVYYANLWLLAVLVFLSPVIIHVLIGILKYSEKSKLRKMELLNNTYYRHVMYLIKVSNEQLAKSENEITHKIYLLGQDEEFHDLVTKTKEVRNIYNDMTKLFMLYKNGGKATKVEKDLLSNIDKLDKNEAFNKAAARYPELGSFKSNLSLLYKAYESKQELYEELRKIEKAAEEGEDDSKGEEGQDGGKNEKPRDEKGTGAKQDEKTKENK